jgi:multidrug resistance efflux pump
MRGVVLSEQLENLVGIALREGDQLLEVGDVSAWRANLSVSEDDVHRIRIGDPVSIEIPAFASVANDRFRGRVVSVATQISAGGAPGGATTSSYFLSGYRVMAALDPVAPDDEKSGALRRGYVVRAKIITRSARLATFVRDYLRGRLRRVGG